MNYELAKELKDAKFPFNWEKKCHACEEAGPHFNCPESTPTLSELIEACSDSFFRLEHREVIGPIKDTELSWAAFPTFEFLKNNKIVIVFCKTPEEAVARLWLTLNKK